MQTLSQILQVGKNGTVDNYNLQLAEIMTAVSDKSKLSVNSKLKHVTKKIHVNWSNATLVLRTVLQQSESLNIPSILNALHQMFLQLFIYTQ